MWRLIKKVGGKMPCPLSSRKKRRRRLRKKKKEKRPVNGCKKEKNRGGR